MIPLARGAPLPRGVEDCSRLQYLLHLRDVKIDLPVGSCGANLEDFIAVGVSARRKSRSRSYAC